MASYLHLRLVDMMGRLVLGVIAVGSFMMACSAPPPAKKAAAAACDPTTGDCPTSGPREKPNDGTLKTTTGAPLEAPEKKGKPAKQPTAGEEGDDDDDDAEPTGGDPIPLPTPRPQDPEPQEDPIGPMCSKLKTCCANLRAAGITGSARQCDEKVEARDELTCDFENESYKTPDESYDPVCF